MESEQAIKGAAVVSQPGSASRPKRLGKPTYMMEGSGINRALEAISGSSKEKNNSSIDDLPMEDEPVQASPSEAPNQNAVPHLLKEVEVTPSPVVENKPGESIADSTPAAPSRNKPKVVSPPTRPAPIKGKGEKTLEDTLYYNLRVGLNPEEVLRMETFCFELRLKVIGRFRRKPAVGLQTLSQFFIKKMASDKAFATGIEDELINFFGTNKLEE